MKKLLVMLILSFFTSVAFSQQEITGIGKLKLGSSTVILKELGYPSKIKSISTLSAYFADVYNKTSGSSVLELINPNDPSSKFTYYPLDPNVRRFYVPKYEVLEGLILTGIELEFHQDSLYSISCNLNPDLNDAFSTKYGQAEITVDKKDKHYKNIYGQDIVKTDKTFLTKWTTNNPNVSCRGYLSTYHDDNGKASTFQHFIISNISTSNMVRQTEDKIKEDIKRQKDEKTKQALEAL